MYELFYGLKRRPFRMGHDLENFFLSQSHKRAMAHLRYGMQQTEGFVVLTGLGGSGKSLLLSLLITELTNQNVQVAHIGDALIDDNDLLPSILSAFNKPIFEYQLRALISQLEAFLLSKAKSGKRSVIVIDEAQNLSQRSLQILRLLSNLQYENHSVLQVILVGDDTLNDIISDPKNHLLRQRIVMSYQMNPMSLDDTMKYIQHRLIYAGWNSDPEIKLDVYDIIHQLSGGLPSEINRLCDRLLMQGMLQKKHIIVGEDVENLLSDDRKYVTTPAIELQKSDEQEVIETVVNVLDSKLLDSQILDSEVLAIEQASVVEETSTTDVVNTHSNIEESKEVPKIEESVNESVKEKTPEIENIYLNELEKEIEKNDEFKDETFQVSEKENEPSAIRTLIFSYAASMLVAIGLFYVTNVTTPETEIMLKPNQDNTLQFVQREDDSIAIID